MAQRERCHGWVRGRSHTDSQMQEKDRYIWQVTRVRVRTNYGPKKGLPSPRAEAGQGNIERVHEPKLIQTTGLLWGQGRRAMEQPYSP